MAGGHSDISRAGRQLQRVPGSEGADLGVRLADWPRVHHSVAVDEIDHDILRNSGERIGGKLQTQIPGKGAVRHLYDAGDLGRAAGGLWPSDPNRRVLHYTHQITPCG